jgi:hypothetical protein
MSALRNFNVTKMPLTAGCPSSRSNQALSSLLTAKAPAIPVASLLKILSVVVVLIIPMAFNVIIRYQAS